MGTIDSDKISSSLIDRPPIEYVVDSTSDTDPDNRFIFPYFILTADPDNSLSTDQIYYNVTSLDSLITTTPLVSNPFSF